MTARARRKARTRMRRSAEAALAFGATLGAAYLFTRKSPAPSSPTPSSTAPSSSSSSKPEPESSPASSVTSSTNGSTAPATGSATQADETTSADGQFRVQTDRVTIDRDLGEGPLDGAWWATSTSAPEAVAALLEELPEEPRVSRLALSMHDWDDDRPKTIQAGDRTVHLAWFAGMQRRTARITFENDEAATVVVLPPDTEQSAAQSALSAAGEDRSSSQLLQEAHVERDSDVAGDDSGSNTERTSDGDDRDRSDSNDAGTGGGSGDGSGTSRESATSHETGNDESASDSDAESDSRSAEEPDRGADTVMDTAANRSDDDSGPGDSGEAGSSSAGT